ncbi:MAG: Trp family transcriptional regulator, partial [Patescibacteria group bacterium]
QTIFEQLVDHVSRVHGRRSKEFLSELLTPTERLQLGKRLTGIIMLMQGFSFSQVGSALKMSETTVVKLWRNMKEGKFPAISAMRAFGRTVHEHGTFEALLRMLTGGMPPRAGRGRWKFLKKI